MNIKLFAFAKGSASVPILAVCGDKINEDALKAEATKVLSQLRSIDLRAQQRQKINTGNGSWFCKRDDKDIYYLMLTNVSYPERLIYEAIQELREHLKKLGKSYSTEQDVQIGRTQSTLKTHARGYMQQLLTKYENPKQVDKVAAVNSNLEEVRSSVRSSVRKILTNQVELEELEQKSMTLRDHASQFSKSATELERLMYWRNCKLKICIGLVVVAILCAIIVPIVTKATGTSANALP